MINLKKKIKKHNLKFHDEFFVKQPSRIISGYELPDPFILELFIPQFDGNFQREIKENIHVIKSGGKCSMIR